MAQPDAWHAWWTSADPEKTPLPHGTSVALTPFQELLFVKVLRCGLCQTVEAACTVLAQLPNVCKTRHAN